MNVIPFLPNLRVRLLLTYLLVIGVGTLVAVITTSLVAPSFYDIHMASMMAPGGMMSGQGANDGMSGTGGMMEGTDTAVRDAYQQAVIQSLLAGMTVAVAVGVAVSFFVSGRIVGPVRRTITAARRIAAGHYAERVPLPGRAGKEGRSGEAHAQDEIGQLAATFNEMAGSLEETERRRVDLLSDVAHELRTPINTLQGYLEGLLDGVMKPSPELWANMHGQAGRLQRLVNDLQDLSRAEARQLSLKIEPLDTMAVVKAAVDGLRPNFVEKGLALSVNLPADLPDVLADRDRAVQVLSNLLGNALRYTPAPGTVTLSASKVLAGQGGDVLFQITDTGIGIAAEHLPHLFERFYRVDKSRTRAAGAAGGSGIGLTIAQALVQVMGGRIWAESAGTGRGSTFSFTLPAAR